MAKTRLQRAIQEVKIHHEDNYDDDDDLRFDDEDAIEELLSECGQTPDGYCTLAGTEHCDFECPFRDEED